MSKEIFEKFGVSLIKDADYNEYIYNENAIWRSQNIEQGDFKSYDALSLRYYHALPNGGVKPKACIVMLHGYCGFFGKFNEMAHYYCQAGYEVFFLEQRGHGYSGRQIDDNDMVHINTYDDYVSDVKTFMDDIVLPEIGKLPCVIFGHSMGGAVATLFLEKYKEYFKAAILSSPMYSIKTGDIPKLAIYLLRANVAILHQERKPFLGGKRFDKKPAFDTGSAMSKCRYDYIFEQRLSDSHYQTNTPTNGWICESFKATNKLLAFADTIKAQVILLTSGKDALVDDEGYKVFMAKAQKAERVDFADAKHELFNATDEIREKYYKTIFEFLDRVIE